jgi:hypothetical protein
VKFRKGELARGGPNTTWRARILGFRKHNALSVQWESGPLAGREALVAAETVEKLPKAWQ